MQANKRIKRKKEIKSSSALVENENETVEKRLPEHLLC